MAIKVEQLHNFDNRLCDLKKIVEELIKLHGEDSEIQFVAVRGSVDAIIVEDGDS